MDGAERMGERSAVFSYGLGRFCERFLQLWSGLQFSLTVWVVFVRDFCNCGADCNFLSRSEPLL